MPLADQVGELALLQDEGKIRHIGLCEVDVAELEAAQQIATIASVQNLFNLADRSAEPLLDHAEAKGIAFIPWFPLATGKLVQPGGPLETLAERARRHAVAAGPGLAAAPLAGDAADPRHVDRRPRRGQHRRRRIELTDEEFDALSAAVG